MTHTLDLATDRDTDALDELLAVLPGQVARPGDDGWDLTRLGWTRSVDQQPFAVVTVHDEEDVVAAVTWAARHGRSVSVQPLGHGATTAVDGTVLLRTGALQLLEVDAERRTARVGAGVTWDTLLAAIGEFGLTGLVGSSGGPTVVGFTLGGGLSWFGRRYGLAAHSVLSWDVVDTRGVRRRVTAGSDPDLFWALRGGGGEFAVVLSMEIALYPVPNLHGGRMMWPVEMAFPVLHAFRELTEHAPPELTAWAQLVQLPPVPEVPEPLRGKSFVTVDLAFLGTATDAEPLLRRLSTIPDRWVDTLGDVAVADIGAIAAEPMTPMSTTEDAWLLTDFDDDAITRLVAIAGHGSGSRFVVTQVRHLGAAFTEATPDDGPAGAILEPYQLFCAAVTETPADVAAARAELAATSAAMTAHRSGRRALNFTFSADPATAFTPDVLARLASFKQAVDPGRVLTGNKPFPARPAST